MTAPAAGERRVALDGLRAVAVYLVVAFHAGLSRFAGGFIGVDVFFVLSGYLVTQVLLRDLDGPGRIRFGRFYSRRVRRLLPALAAALTVTAVFYAVVAGPVQVAESIGAFKASFLYVVNWYFIDQSTDYFAGDTAQSPVLHIWSLAVEEQFYLLWPLLFGALAWATSGLARHRASLWRAAIAAAALASATWALVLRDAQPERAYYGTDTRAYQLLAGALLALTPSLVRWVGRTRWLALLGAPVGLLAIGVLSVRLSRLDPIERGLAVTVATLVVIVALEADVGGPVQRVLSVRPIVYLGQISYGTYLWHWPVIVIVLEVADVAPRPLAVVAALVATGLASLSYHLLELPVRAAPRLDRLTWPVVGVGVAASIVAALVVIPQLLESDDEGGVAVATASTDAFTPVPAAVDPKALYFEGFGDPVNCVGEPAENCTVVEGDGSHILLVGDSNAVAWTEAFVAMAEAEGATLSVATATGCPWQRDFYRLSEEIRERCRRVKTDTYDRLIAELDPDVIVLSNAREPLGPPNEEYTADRVNEVLRDTTPASVAELDVDGREVVMIEPLALPVDDEFDPRVCLEDAAVVEECRFVADATADWHTRLQRDLAEASPNVYSADLDRLACPFLPICDAVVGDVPVFWNERHLTRAYSRGLGPDLADFFRSEGLLEG